PFIVPVLSGAGERPAAKWPAISNSRSNPEAPRESAPFRRRSSQGCHRAATRCVAMLRSVAILRIPPELTGYRPAFAKLRCIHAKAGGRVVLGAGLERSLLKEPATKGGLRMTLNGMDGLGYLLSDPRCDQTFTPEDFGEEQRQMAAVAEQLV